VDETRPVGADAGSRRRREAVESFWETRAEGTPQRILMGATSAFVDLGYHGASTREIALRSGMSATAMYVHFSSKQDLLFAISRAGHDATSSAVLDNMALASQPGERIRLGIGGLTSFNAEHAEMMRMLEYEYKSLTRENRRTIAETRADIEAHIRSTLEAGVASGEFTIHDVESMVVLLLSISIDVTRWYRTDPIRTPTVLGLQYADLALRLLT